MRAYHSHTLAEQKALLEQAIAREISQRVRDDTSTVREQSTISGTDPLVDEALGADGAEIPGAGQSVDGFPAAMPITQII